MRTPWVILAVLAIVGFSAPVASAADTSQTIDGRVVLNDGFGTEGDPCVGTGKFADLKPGATVTVKDAHKKTIGSGALGDGTWTADITGSDFVHCEFPFTVPVSAAKTYVVRVGKRKAGSVSRKALLANDWVMTISVG
jgi:hypothetical protein